MALVSMERLSKEIMILLSSMGLFGILISVTSNRPSSSFTFLPVIFLKPPTERELVTMPKMKSSSTSFPSQLTFMGKERIEDRLFTPSSRYAIWPSTFFISCPVS